MRLYGPDHDSTDWTSLLALLHLGVSGKETGANQLILTMFCYPYAKKSTLAVGLCSSFEYSLVNVGKHNQMHNTSSRQLNLADRLRALFYQASYL